MKAILMIDIQNDYFKGGRNELYQPEKAAANAGRALTHFRNSGLPVFHVQHISSREGATYFLPGTEGAMFHNSVKPLPEEPIFVKHTPNSFFQTGLDEELMKKRIDELVICGMMSHMCIDTTVRAARDLGFAATVLHDACATKDLEWDHTMIPAETVHNVFMASLQGIFAKMLSTEEFLKEEG